MRACASCGRTIGKVAARCLYCGTVAADAPAAAATAQKAAIVKCPGCLRTARVAPGAKSSCSFCAIAFHVDDDGVARVGRASTTPAATHAQVNRLVSALPSARLWDAVRDVLLRRSAYSELGAGEAERAIDALTLIATWPGDSPQWLPIAIDDAVAIVPRAIFGVVDGGLLTEGGHTVLLSTIGTISKSDLAARTADRLFDIGAGLAISAVTTSLGLGFGVSVESDEKLDNAVRLQLRSYLVAHEGGVHLTDVFNQIDQKPWAPPSVAQERELHTRIASSRPLLAALTRVVREVIDEQFQSCSAAPRQPQGSHLHPSVDGAPGDLERREPQAAARDARSRAAAGLGR